MPAAWVSAGALGPDSGATPGNGKMLPMPRAARPPTADPCPCGSNLSYGDCCGLYHDGPLALQAPGAEALMRSRYSAYVHRLTDYLLATWHHTTRPSSLQADPPDWHWLGLEVRAVELVDADHATVEFVARGKSGGRAQRLHEVSRFVREGGRWYYLDAAGGA